MQLTEVRIAGFGGQGVILAANIIGRAAAICHGGYATMTQSYGPEARGGAASAQVIISESPILYPYATQPNVQIVMAQEAYSRFASQTRSGGTLIVEEELVRLEHTPKNVRIYGIPATRIAEELGKKMVLNVVIVGFFAAVTGLLTKKDFLDAVAVSVPKQHVELNKKAFEAGYEYGASGKGLYESTEVETVLATPESLG
jgi:2-oxoglutarate ferredoxin oxidoreductase subunit gamma